MYLAAQDSNLISQGIILFALLFPVDFVLEHDPKGRTAKNKDDDRLHFNWIFTLQSKPVSVDAYPALHAKIELAKKGHLEAKACNHKNT